MNLHDFHSPRSRCKTHVTRRLVVCSGRRSGPWRRPSRHSLPPRLRSRPTRTESLPSLPTAPSKRPDARRATTRRRRSPREHARMLREPAEAPFGVGAPCRRHKAVDDTTDLRRRLHAQRLRRMPSEFETPARPPRRVCTSARRASFRNSLSFSVDGGVRCAQETRVGGG